jgi:hypothetical protein
MVQRKRRRFFEFGSSLHGRGDAFRLSGEEQKNGEAGKIKDSYNKDTQSELKVTAYRQNDS